MIEKQSTHVSPRMALRSPEVASLITRVRDRGLTYLSDAKVLCLCESVLTVEANGVEGGMIEAGCALGGSSILIASLKATERPLSVYDVFRQIPAPTERDGSDAHARFREIQQGRSPGIGRGQYYGYVADLYQQVCANLAEFGVEKTRDHVRLIPGLLEETLRCDGPVAFAHVDVDWYDPVMTCLERVVPRLSVGGILIIDDYADWSGCRLATDRFFAERGDAFQLNAAAGSMQVTRVRPD